MSDLQKSMEGLVGELETEGKKARNFTELEQVVLKYSQELSQTAYQELSQDFERKISPPGEALC